MEKITINGAVYEWIQSCFHHQKSLSKKIEDEAKITHYFDLKDCDNKKVIAILTDHEEAWFEDNELVYNAAITPKQFAIKQANSQRRLDYMVKKINHAIYSDEEIRTQVKTYLEAVERSIEGLNLS